MQHHFPTRRSSDLNVTFSAQTTITGTLPIAGTYTCNAAATVDTINLSGLLTGTGTVTITTALNWTGGQMSGTGKTLILPAAVATISTASQKTLSNGRTFDNQGTVN